MPALSFPPSPAVNDLFTASGKTWRWNGTFWELVLSGPQIADGSVSSTKIADGGVTTAKIATGAVTAAKLGNDIQLTPPNGSITQAKLAASLSGITVTTTANRGTDVPSPFTGQTVYLSDVTRLQVWNGSAWTFITNGAPGAPTALSATPLSTTSVSVAFTTGALAGSAITNYKYAYSSNGGSTYSEFAALDPVDTTSPVVISGLVGATTYLIKLRAVSDFGDSVDSSAVSVTTLTPPAAPTSLSATGFYLMGRISFTPGADGGSAITNYEYALSTNSGATYGAFTALSPADATSPIDITGLANNTTYSVKLRAITANGAGIESSAVSVTTNQNFESDYLVVAGGGGGGNGNESHNGGGGGAGGLRSTVTATGGGGTLESALTITAGVTLTVMVGGGGASNSPGVDSSISGSAITTITSTGGGRGKGTNNSANGGSGGGGHHTSTAGGTGTPNQGFDGGAYNSGTNRSAGGGGAGAVGATNDAAGVAGNGGAGVATSISGSSVTYAGGGGGGSFNLSGGSGGAGGGGAGSLNAVVATAGSANKGGGGGGSGATGNPGVAGGAGGSGVVILRYPSARTITIGAGLTGTTATVGSNKVTTLTAGSGNVSWS